MEKTLCSLCSSSPQFLCFCERVLLCSACLSLHMLSSPTTRHHPVALGSQDLDGRLIPDFSPIHRDCHSREERPESKSRLRRSLKSELQRLQQFRSFVLQQLQEVRDHWVQEINRATHEIELIVKAKCEAISKELLQCVSDLDEFAPSPLDDRVSALTRNPTESLLDLSLNLLPLDLNTLVKQFVNLSLDFTKPAQEEYLYKFFGGQGTVNCFDPRTEKIISTARTHEKFLHNACWVSASTGELYVTGGSLMGRSKDCVFTFSPKTEVITVLPAMKTPRRSHTSVYIHSRLYVFGGMCDEQQLALGENWTENWDYWQALPPMKSARAYLGSAVYEGKVYLAGGSEMSGVEVYDPGANSFTFVPIVGLAEACSLIAVDSSITILHGNTQGEALSFTPSTQKCKRLSAACHGNSWSNCSPLLYKDVIYTIRSDSIFKFDMTTCESNYVLWVTKSGKKRRGLDETFLA